MPMVLTAAQMRAVDRAAIAGGVPGLVLMENAGRGTVEAMFAARPDLLAGPGGRRIVVACGAGQNGGDGFVIARHLANRGAQVQVLLAAPAARIGGDASLFLNAARQTAGVAIEDLSGEQDAARWQDRLEGAGVLVDAIFGTGLRSEVAGAAAAAIAAMNRRPAFRVAVDIPSGLDADSGRTRGAAFRADLTATMGAHKLGLVLDADAPVGQVVVVDLGVSLPALLGAAQAEGPLCHLLDGAEVAPLLHRQRRSGHKGSRGHALVVAGSAGKTGAAALSALACLRAGAGLVTVASTAAGQAALDAKVLEPMTARYCDGEDAEPDSQARLEELGARMKAAALGPGVPTGPGMRALVSRLAAEWPLPLVIDADGLNLLAHDDEARARLPALGRAPAGRLLTPHPGEMARLCGTGIKEVQADRLGTSRALAARTGAVVILKGARTVIARPDGTAFLNPAADPALGTAGSGDVLTGVLAGLLAQGLPLDEAARVGVFAHGQAASVARAQLGTGNLIAGDLPLAIARVLADLLERAATALRAD